LKQTFRQNGYALADIHQVFKMTKMSVIAGKATRGSHHTQCAEHFHQDPWVPDEEQHNKLCMCQPKRMYSCSSQSMMV